MERRKKVVFLFPGQGSLKDAKNSELLKTTYAVELDKKAQAVIGESIIEKILEASEEDYSKTVFSQPATFFLGLLSYLIAKEEKEIYVVAAAGHSLGELVALTASGFFDISTAFYLVAQRARLMEMCCKKELSSMLAVIGSNPASLASLSGSYGVYPANFNSKNQVVFAGTLENLNRFKEEVQRIGYRTVYLKVEGAFHSPLMDYASHQFGITLKKQRIGFGTFPVIANIDAKPYTREDLVEKLSRQISSPVRWVDVIDRLTNYMPDIWVEAYPGNVLLKLLPDDVKGKRIAIRSLEDFERF